MEMNFEELKKRFYDITKKDCYSIKLIYKETPSILDNKLGGIPYIPVGEEIPKDKNGDSMVLLLQVNLKDVDLEEFDKKEGILEIFIDDHYTWPCDYCIKIFKEGLEYKKDLKEANLEEFFLEKPYKINLERSTAYMPFADYRFDSTIKRIICDMYNLKYKEKESIDSLLENNFENATYNDLFNVLDEIEEPYCTLGGYANFTQNDPRDYDEKMKDYVCLFKLDSNLDTKAVMIGDCGIVFVLMPKGDILKGVVDWDCG